MVQAEQVERRVDCGEGALRWSARHTCWSTAPLDAPASPALPQPANAESGRLVSAARLTIHSMPFPTHSSASGNLPGRKYVTLLSELSTAVIWLALESRKFSYDRSIVRGRRQGRDASRAIFPNRPSHAWYPDLPGGGGKSARALAWHAQRQRALHAEKSARVCPSSPRLRHHPRAPYCHPPLDDIQVDCHYSPPRLHKHPPLASPPHILLPWSASVPSIPFRDTFSFVFLPTMPCSKSARNSRSLGVPRSTIGLD